MPEVFFFGNATRKSGATWRPIQDQKSKIGGVDAAVQIQVALGEFAGIGEAVFVSVVFLTFDAEEFIFEMAEEKGGRMRPPVFNARYFINP